MEVIYTRHITLREGAGVAIIGRCVSCNREHERTGRRRGECCRSGGFVSFP
jgi:hypothetical protein